MPYSIENPPEKLKGMPKHAIEIFVAAFNAAFSQYKGDEGKAHAVAYAAVKTKYEQDKDGNWIARESIESLRLKYAELIQESAKRGFTDDKERIKKVLELCQAILNSPQGEEIQVGEAIKEAEACLAWLKEQQIMKTEEGEKFPATAFAYTPDLGNSAGWKLRLWDRGEISRKKLAEAAAALSPGGFRGQRVEIPSADLSAVKRKIRVAYRGLDVPDEEIPRWVMESQSRELIAEVTPLSEAKMGNKGIAQLVVIQPGFNANKERYYPAETLARDFGIFEGAKMFADHATESEEKDRPERSIKDWVATLKNVKVDEQGKIIGEAVVIEPWMQEKLATLRDKGLLSEMGVSINAVGTAVKSTIEGIKTNLIEKLNRIRSVDFVTWPGAGGMVTLYEADKEHDVDLVNLATFKERRPDLVKQIESTIKAEIMQEVKRKMELEDKVKELEGQNAALTQENTDLKAKLTEADKAKAKAEAQAKIKEAVGKAELPDAAKTKLQERFKESETDDGILEAVKAEGDYIAALADAGKVKGLGPSKENTEADHKALIESFKRTGMNDKEAEIAAKGR